MSTEQNKALIKRAWDEVFNQKKLTVVDELWSSDYIYHGPQGQELRGPESLKQFISHYLEAFPDLHIEIEDLIAEGDKVVSRVVSRGTHKGELQGIAPTGNEVTTTLILITRLADGKVVEDWESRDDLGMLQQLGVIPAE
ncbi:MAG: ester cyclase [Deltaproteobacteria bacterium]|nr:ester cyclase [Deltaproteobacteria bacterium]